MSINVEHEVFGAIIDLIRVKPFYGHVLQQLLKVYFEDTDPLAAAIPTIAVGRKEDELLIKLYTNRDFIRGNVFGEPTASKREKWCHGDPRKFLRECLEHEVIHLALQHLALKFSDKKRGGIACDLAANSYLDPKVLTCGHFPADYKFPPAKSAMWYYDNLAPPTCPSKEFDSHAMWEWAANDPLFQEYIKGILNRAKETAGGYGHISGDLSQFLDDLLRKRKSVIPWQRILRTFVASVTENNLSYSMRRESKRFGTHPGTKKQDVLNLAVAVDTSGSITDSMLGTFFNEVRWIWKNGAKVTVFEADCTVQKSYPFKGVFMGEVHGRGGTDLTPVLEATERKFDALVYFTDFEAPIIERHYAIPVLWVLTHKPEYCPCDWGKRIVINQKE